MSKLFTEISEKDSVGFHFSHISAYGLVKERRLAGGYKKRPSYSRFYTVQQKNAHF